MPKLRKRTRSDVPHLTWRGNVAYWERRDDKLPGGRVVKSLEVKHDRSDLAAQYAHAINTLCERGDWNVIRRWVDGDVHITEVARAVREGDYSKLNRLNVAGTLLGDAIEAFMRRTRATLAKRTGTTYESILRQLLEKFGADYPMAGLSTDAAEAFLHETKLYGTTQQRPITWSAHMQSTARTIYKALWRGVIDREQEDAERQGAVPSVTKNPWVKARIPKRRKTRQSFLTRDQWKALIEHPSIRQTPQDAFLCAGIMGLRRAETAHLRTGKDVVLDVARPYLHIQSRGGKHAWNTKTENSVRKVPIPAKLIPHFQYHAAHFAREEYFFAAEGHDEPLGASTCRRWTMNCFKAAGIRYGREGDAVTQHSLRHTCATWMLSAGVPITTVAKWLGDTNEMVLSTYGHAIPGDDERAERVMEEMV